LSHKPTGSSQDHLAHPVGATLTEVAEDRLLATIHTTNNKLLRAMIRTANRHMIPTPSISRAGREVIRQRLGMRRVIHRHRAVREGRRRHQAITIPTEPMVAVTAHMVRRLHMERRRDMERRRATRRQATRPMATHHHLDTAHHLQATPLAAMPAKMVAATAATIVDAETGVAVRLAGNARRARAELLMVAVVAAVAEAKVTENRKTKEEPDGLRRAKSPRTITGPSQTSILTMCFEI